MTLIVDEMRRFRMLVAGIMVSVAVSTMYGFSMFTEKLKDKYGFSQGDLTTISTVCSVLGYCAFFFGVLLDYAGPKFQLVISGVCALIGLVLFGLCLDDKIHSESRQTMLILISLFNGIMYFGCPAMDGGSVIPLLMNFPVNRGHVIIIQKSFPGIGTAILMAYFNAFFKESTTDTTKFSAYAYFLAAQAMFCTCFGAVLLDFPCYNPCDRLKKKLTAEELEERKDTLNVYLRQHAPFRRIVIGAVIVIALVIHLTVASIYGAYTTISKGGYIAIWVITILILASTALLAAPFQFLGPYRVPDRASTKFIGMGEVDGVPGSYLKEPIVGEEEQEKELEDDDEEEGEAKNRELQRAEGEDKDAPVVFSTSGDPQYPGGFWGHLLSLDLWLMWLAFFGTWGTNTVFQYNSAQIYRSKNYGGYSDSSQSFNVALIGVGSAVGRCIGGILDNYTAKRRARRQLDIYTTLFLPLCPFLLVIGFLLMILIPAKAIVFPFILCGMGNGMSWGLAAVSVRLVYAQDMGKHYNFLFSSGIVATIFLNRFMFGDMFDNYAMKEGTSPFCNKPSCVTNQLWILLACNVVSTLAAVVLHWRFSRFANGELRKMNLIK